MKFSDVIGQEIAISIPYLAEGTGKLQRVKLVGVEAGGIWIESQELIDIVLEGANLASAPRTPVFFFPYSQIVFAVSSTDSVALSEKAFDL